MSESGGVRPTDGGDAGTKGGPSSPSHATPDTRGYYGLPVLKMPVWRWEIWAYFFLGGLAAGSYVVASLATLFGDARDRGIARTGHVVSFLAIVLCPPLLIKDLGRPERFLNMLRVFKPASPMNLGVWTLLAFSGVTTAAFFREVLGQAWGPIGWLARAVPVRLLAAAGVPLACLFGSYTGVLLSATSVPLWARSRLLAPAFLASAFSSGVAAISLFGSMTSSPADLARLRQVERAGALAEAAALAGYLRQTDRAAKPLLDPTQYGRPFLLGAVGLGILVPFLASLSPGLHRSRATTIVSLCTLVGGLCLRYALVEGGRASSLDPEVYFWMTDELERWAHG
jgi:formate-dependent nitrite reductase membrane component NrfD